DDERRVCRARDLELVLPDADGLDDDDVGPPSVEDTNDVNGRARQPAERASGRKRPDEDVRIAEVPLHPNAVTEDGAARERAGRIDGDDCNALLLTAVFGDEAIGQRALARARIAGDADGPSPAGVRAEVLEDGEIVTNAVVDEATHARRRTRVSIDYFL